MPVSREIEVYVFPILLTVERIPAGRSPLQQRPVINETFITCAHQVSRVRLLVIFAVATLRPHALADTPIG